MENPEEDSQETMQTHGEEPSKSSPEKVETNNGDGALALQLQEQVQSDDESELDKYDDDFDELNNQTGGKELQFSRLSEAICGLEERLAARLTEQIERGIAQAMLQVKTQEGSERRGQRGERDMDITQERPVEPLNQERQLCVKASHSDDGSTVSTSDALERNKGQGQIISKTASGRNASPTLSVRSVRKQQPDSEERFPSATEPKEPLSADDFANKWEKGMERIIATIERPKPAMPTFSGESREEFALFMRRFTGYLEGHPVRPKAKLEMLIAACTGEEMKDALVMYTQLDPEEGYKEAMEMLQERLGSTQDHMDEAIHELQHGPQIQDTDKRGLDQFINKLWNTFIALQLAGRQADLDNFGILSNLANRLTGKLRERYEDQLLKYKTKKDSRPGIKWFRGLLMIYSRKLQQVFSKTQGDGEKKGTQNADNKAEGGGQGSTAKRKAEEDSKDATVKRRAMGFASTAGWPPGRRNQNDKRQNPTPCVLCNRNHPLFACWDFRFMSVAERWEATKKAQACYICLGLGHTASECKVPKQVCGLQGCTQKHSRWLHRPEKRKDGEPERIVTLYTPEVKHKAGYARQEDA